MSSKELNNKPKIVKLIAECYANKCIADKLSEILKKHTNYIIDTPLHNYKLGRDRIIKDILKKQSTKHLVIAIIDYERGVSRVYIDKNFKKLGEVEGPIIISVSKQRPNVAAIIFDPDIEEAFLCKMSRNLCKDPHKLERIKSIEACQIIEKLLDKSDEGRNLLNKLSEEILSKFLNAKKSAVNH